jgi:predicted Zn-dependent protease
VLVELARVMLARGRPDEAIAPATDAVADFRRRGDPRGVAGGYLCLGRAHAALGDRRTARAMLDEALTISDRWGYAGQSREARRVLAELPAAIAPA